MIMLKQNNDLIQITSEYWHRADDIVAVRHSETQLMIWVNHIPTPTLPMIFEKEALYDTTPYHAAMRIIREANE